MKNSDIEGKKILVIGMARSGVAAANALSKLGAAVYVQDSKKKEELDAKVVADFEKKNIKGYYAETPNSGEITFDMLVLSPGVPPELDFIKAQKEKGAEITGELEIAYRVGKGKYVAITGTNGKTTTTTLTGEIFKAAGRKTEVVGNIGVPVISASMEADDDTWLVTEASSFQLETVSEFRPVVSALLNLTPDHLNRHKTMENYASAKANVFKNQTKDEYFVVNYDDEPSRKIAEGCGATVVPFTRKEKLDFGAFVSDGRIVIKNEKGETADICGADELQIPGTHNLENALAAAAISYFAGISPDTIAQVLRSFTGVEHRLEYVDTIKGVRFVNDSKGTNPDSSIKAVEAISGKMILIAGGYDKGSEFDELIAAFGGKVRHMILLGKTAPKIRETAEKMGFSNITTASDMEECVKKGFELAEEGDTVLLSPACASWDMYSCFEERGEHFKKCVAGLEK
ncbi:MAG: UDP-N-acetylmuramoyl-L-alanine--D-glutamate ligase [Clostridia bacterium]|nr:UDP-N-acetylmuramoyl-L-alanine--D-glutamate ligase [Clostridia bacterium]